MALFNQSWWNSYRNYWANYWANFYRRLYNPTESDLGRDTNGDGLISGGRSYQLASSKGGVTLKDSRGNTFSDRSSSLWNATAAKETKDGFEVLLEGQGSFKGLHQVWSTNQDGIIQSKSGWKTTREAVQAGFEQTFSKDFDGNGLIEGIEVTDYRLATGNQSVTLKNSEGIILTDGTSRDWDVTDAAKNGSGFVVLAEGESKEQKDQFFVWNAKSDGIITNEIGWKTKEEAVSAGWENTFEKDLNSDGLISGGNNYQLASDRGAITLQSRSGHTYSDNEHRYWDVEAATQTDNGFEVLLNNKTSSRLKHYVWTTDKQGTIKGYSGWKTTQQAVDSGWEETFNKDLNLDGFIGSRITDAAGDASEKEVFEDGALKIDFNADKLKSLKGRCSGFINAYISATSQHGHEINLGSTKLDLNKNSFYVNLKDQLDGYGGALNYRKAWTIDVDIKASYSYGLNKTLESFTEDITLIKAIDHSGTKGDVTANTFNYSRLSGIFSNLGTGRIYQGRGGTDTLKMHGISKADILEFNGATLEALGTSAGGLGIGKQAIYGGTAFDVLNLRNGDEIYLQGIEKIECTDGDIQVRAGMSDSTKEQWNLQAMDVSGAWRFNRGSSDVKLVSLDTGIGDIAGNPTDIHDEISHVQNKTGKHASSQHGHKAMSVMAAKHDSQNLAGIAPGSDLWAYNVYAGGDSLYDSINDAKGLRQDGEKLVFQGGIQGNWGWTHGASKADMEDLIESTADDSFFAIAAGNGGPTGNLPSERATYMDSVSGVAQAQTDNDHVSSVGALEFTGTEVIDGITNVTGYQLAAYSNRGDNLTYVAPTNSRSINGDGNVETFRGTSCANPNAAGVAALIWSENTGLEGSDVREIMTQSAMDLGASGRDNTYGHGLLNAEAAVRRSHALAENQQLASFYSNDEFLA